MTIEEILEENGWTITCQSPLEMEHEDGSVATLQAADIVIDYLESEADEQPQDPGKDYVDVVLDEEDIEQIEYLINGNGGDERDAVEEFLQGRFRDYFEMDDFDEPESYELIFDYKGNKYHMEIEENGCCESAHDHRIMYWTRTVTKL